LFFDRLGQFGNVEGVEVDQSMKTGVEAIDSKIHWGTLETMPAGQRYTVVLLLDVLEHLPNPESELRRVLEALEPAGLVLVTVPAFPILWTQHDNLNHHLRRYTKQSFKSLAASVGLRTLALRYFFHWTFPAKLVVRALERFGHSEAGRPNLPSVPPGPINQALYLLSRLEQRLGMWRYCPFGSSLLFMGTHADPETVSVTAATHLTSHTS
jgi:hypothetical protein